MEWNENAILLACIENDTKAQEALYRHFSGPMFKICCGYTQSIEDAKDILQEGFIRVFEQISTFRHESGLYAWIRKIFIYTAIDFYRKSLRNKIKTVTIQFDHEDELALYIPDNTDMAYYNRLISEMPIGYKLIFNLYAVEGYSHKEIAEITGLSEGTSKSQLARARKYLQAQLKGEQEVYTLKYDVYEGSIGRLVPASF